MTSISVDEFRTRLAELSVRVLGAPALSEPEVQAALDEQGLEDDEELPVDAQWAAFAPMSNELLGRSGDDELFEMFLSVWAGPYPEEQFLDPFEMREAIGAGVFPAEFLALLESATEGYTLFEDPPQHAGLFSDEWGWALGYADRMLQFRTPLDLLEHIAAQSA